MIHQLEADSIQLSFGGRTILSNIYIQCTTGKITGLLERNGQGKSCLMKIIYGTLATESKSVRIDNTAVFEAHTQPHLLRYLPQFNFIPQSLSLESVFRDFEVDFAAFEKRFPELDKYYKQAIGELSSGERRLIELYVLLMASSQFGLLDEPFTHLNPLQIEKLKRLWIGNP